MATISRDTKFRMALQSPASLGVRRVDELTPFLTPNRCWRLVASITPLVNGAYYVYP